ncbi:MAG TPA: CHASE3 domain-containing protein [Burkholderiales bacterium]|nr:CHASE3 domain-containing protein [Burkholderiales bacterium]
MKRGKELFLLGLGAVVVILLTLNVQLAFTNTRQLHDHNRWVLHSREVVDGLANVLSLMKDAETGQRGYLMTGEPEYLEPYNAAILAIDGEFARLAKLTADNERQQAHLPRVAQRIARTLELLDENISVRRDRGVEAARSVMLIDRSKKEMDALRADIGQMLQEERGLLDVRVERAERSYRWAIAAGLVSGMLALVGIVAFIILLQRHMRERAKAAAVQFEQRELLRITLASIGDAIITTDTSGRVNYLNSVAETLTGWTQKDAAGKSLETVFHIVNEQTGEKMENPASRALRAGVSVGLANHTVLIARDGARHPIDDSASPIRDERSTIVGCVLVFRDVTERRHSEEKLRRSEEMLRQRVDELAEGDRRKDEFLATLAHELRNPLGPLSNALAIMKVGGDDPQLMRSTRELMERQLGQMVRLIDDLLDVSRISRGKLDLRLARLELSAIVHLALEICQPLAEKAAHRLEIDLPVQPIYVQGDSVRLAQVFCNLLSNAFKFTPREGHIKMTAAREGDEVIVSIKDNGIGIPSHHLSAIFEMFTQLDRTLEQAQGGLGIGLTLVRRLVGMHGGSVIAKSDGPGKGAEFVVRLPIAEDQTPLPENNANTADGSMPHGSRLRVLIVDDNHDSADSLSLLLKLTGNEVETAHDGLRGVEAAERFRPEMILLDIGLPGLNGYDVARKIRELPFGKEILLVALTGWGQEEDRRKSRDAGFDRHLIKPLDYNVLMEILGSVRGPR